MGNQKVGCPPPHSHRNAIPAARAHQDMVRCPVGSIRPLPETAKTPRIRVLSVALMPHICRIAAISSNNSHFQRDLPEKIYVRTNTRDFRLGFCQKAKYFAVRNESIHAILCFRPVSPLSGHSLAAGRRGGPTLSPDLDPLRHTSLEFEVNKYSPYMSPVCGEWSVRF